MLQKFTYKATDLNREDPNTYQDLEPFLSYFEIRDFVSSSFWDCSYWQNFDRIRFYEESLIEILANFQFELAAPVLSF